MAHIELAILDRFEQVFGAILAFKKDLAQRKKAWPDLYEKVSLCKKGYLDRHYNEAHAFIDELKSLEGERE